MPFYATDLVDLGVQPGKARFKPRGFDQSPRWAILRLDGVQVILWSETPIVAAGVNQFADHQSETLVAGARTGFANLRGDARPIPTICGDAIGDLLMNPANARWPALRSMKDGFFRVKMGNQLVWSARDPAGRRRASVEAVDDFTRTAGNLDGSTSSDSQFTWSETSGTLWTTNGTQAEFTNSTNNEGLAQAQFDCDTDDIEVELDLTVTHISNDTTFANIARGGTALTGAGGGYFGYTFAGSSDVSAGIIERVSNTEIVSGGTVAAQNGTYKLVCDGSLIELFRDGLSVCFDTDTAITGINRGGIYAFAQGSTDVINPDNFAVRDVGFGVVPASPPMFRGA